MVMIEWHMVILKYDTCTGKDAQRKRERERAVNKSVAHSCFPVHCALFSAGFQAKNPFNAIDDNELTECDRTDFFQLQCNILRLDVSR